jgi:hypothetical protein
VLRLLDTRLGHGLDVHRFRLASGRHVLVLAMISARHLAVAAFIVATGCASSSSSSPSYGTPNDCANAGGRCVIPGPEMCATEGPPNTCNCNPGCNPGGFICCIAFVDASE